MWHHQFGFTVSKMATTPCKCRGKKSKICNSFLFSLMRDSHELCVMCRIQNCSVNLRCDFFASWSGDKWSLVQACVDELQNVKEGRRGNLK